MLRNLDSRHQSHGAGDGIQAPAQMPGKKVWPAMSVMALIFIAGLVTALVLDHFQLPRQAGLPLTKLPEQSDKPDAGSNSSADLAAASVQTEAAGLTQTAAETAPGQSLVKPPNDATKLTVEQAEVFTGDSQAVTGSGSIVSTANNSDGPVAPILSLADSSISQGAFESTAATESREPGPTDADREVQELLREAGLAIVRERLTSPSKDNALDRYRRVLEMVPDHPEAVAGIDEIVGTYLKLARNYLQAGNIDRARLLVERAEQIAGPNARIADMRAQLVARSSANGKSKPLASGNGGIPADLDSSELNVRQNSDTTRTEQAFLEEVEVLLQGNAQAEALNRLEQYLVTHADSVATIEVLFKLYLRSSNQDMAQKLLDRSPQLPHVTAIELGARLKVQRGELADAVRMLESAVPDDDDTSFYALLAGLYQKLGRFTEAASHYRRLLSVEPDQGTYWLGLAVSLDSLQQSQGALTAFRRTRDSGQYEGDVQRYIEQRINALSR
jgi:tetratricopeptide (TPR) repeat protein